MENLFEKGCLVQLSISKWGGVKKIDQHKLAKMMDSPEWVTASKKLVDPESLKPIGKVGNAARVYLNTVSLPFPLSGMVFVPKEMITRVDERLKGFELHFENAVNIFTQDYDTLRKASIKYLKDLFNEIDYPLDIRNKFSFAWRFIVFDVPNGESGILAPEVYEREKEKFIQTMDEARELAINCLREEFASMVEHITDRFTDSVDGKPKVFKNATIESFYEYFETFKDRNIFNDDQLNALVEKAHELLGNNPADLVRSDAKLKNKIKEGMDNIEEAIAKVMNRPRRKIIMD